MKLFITFCFLFFSAATGYAQISGLPSKRHGIFLRGTIKNYSNQSLFVYQCYADTLLFVDSIQTDEKGKFVFNKFSNQGIYRFNLPRNQWFYILNDGPVAEGIEIKTVYHPDIFNNWASDSLEVILSEENKLFYEFQQVQKKVVVANFVMREMLRLFPYYDSYRNEMEKEYQQRYAEMEKLLQNSLKKYPDADATKIIKAYYTLNPDWKQPDNWRDSIIATHYFDYFNPADSFYLHTNILPEKIDNYFNLFSFLMRVNRETHSDYEKHIIKAADEFLKHTVNNAAVHEFCLQYILKKSDREKMYDALFSVYDKWVYHAIAGDCEQTNPALNKWREKISVLRNIQPGSIAPDFEIVQGRVKMHQLPADYTLLVFWATWCPHCTEEVPEIKKAIENFPNQQKGKTLAPVFVSLDYEEKTWNVFIVKNNISSYTHFCDFKGWKSELVKKYNVYATPSLFLLDQDKKIIAKPETAEQLSNFRPP